MKVPTIKIEETDYTETLGEVAAGRVVYLPQFENRAFLRMAADEPDPEVVMLASLADGKELRVPSVWKCASTDAEVAFAEGV